ncbi:MAG TPA: hypothetical protein VJ962_10635 [Clostridia bacterium]|nr:hypothetical protein [Clostridia bacterium]
MPQGIIDKLYLARDIGIVVILSVITLYILYRIVDHIIFRRQTTLQIITDSLYNYDSFIKVDYNINYLRKYVLNQKVFNELNEVLVEEQRNFKKLIDQYTKRKGFKYYMFSEYSNLEETVRHSELLIVELSLLGKIKSYKRINKDDEELEYLRTM